VLVCYYQEIWTEMSILVLLPPHRITAVLSAETAMHTSRASTPALCAEDDEDCCAVRGM